MMPTALRCRKEGELGEIALDSLIEKLTEEVKMKVSREYKP